MPSSSPHRATSRQDDFERASDFATPNALILRLGGANGLDELRKTHLSDLFAMESHR